MDDTAHDDAVNPNDPPERQALERQLAQDMQGEHQLHSALQEELRLADVHHEVWHGHPDQDSFTTSRIIDLEGAERQLASKIVADRQAIDLWDHGLIGTHSMPADNTATPDDEPQEGTDDTADAGDEPEDG